MVMVVNIEIWIINSDSKLQIFSADEVILLCGSITSELMLFGLGEYG